MFENPLSFSGRIRRTEYGISMILIFFITFLLVVISIAAHSGPLLMYVFLIPVFWIGLAQGAKRCHDIGNSGVVQILPFYFLWLLFTKSNPGQNKYGQNPKVDIPLEKVKVNEDQICLYSEPSINSTKLVGLLFGDNIEGDFLTNFKGFFKVKFVIERNSVDMPDIQSVNPDTYRLFLNGKWEGTEIINSTIIYYYLFEGETLKRSSNYRKMFKNSEVQVSIIFKSNRTFIQLNESKKLFNLELRIISKNEIMINDLTYFRIPIELDGYIAITSKFLRN